jgi:hypothetical protein
MAIKLIEESYCPYMDDNRHSYVIDSAADVASLPKCCTGSIAVVAEKGGAVYMVNASGEWREQ